MASLRTAAKELDMVCGSVCSQAGAERTSTAEMRRKAVTRGHLSECRLVFRSGLMCYPGVTRAILARAS